MAAEEEFSDIHQQEIYKHYQSLQIFFNITGIKHDRSKSMRAQKARLKLIKLSLLQFYELSTDVYDELNRRISEDQTTPNYLLPKANFHLKRNQARQKLANLSQTRFNDLVDDILYEIRRRSLDKNTYFSENETSMVIDENDSHMNSVVNSIAPNPSLQEIKVIPKRASINWTSDEEDENVENGKFATNILPPDTSSFNISNFHSEPENSENDISGGNIEEAKEINLNQKKVLPFNSNAENFNDDDDDFNVESKDNFTHDISNKDFKSSDNIIREVIEERFELPDSTEGSVSKPNQDTESQLLSQVEDLNSQLEELKKENLLLKSTPSKEQNPATDTIEFESKLKDELAYLSNQVSTLLIENENLKQTISELKINRGTDLNLGADNILTALNKKYPLNKESLSAYISSDGYIPFKLVNDLNGLFNYFYEVLIQENENNIGNTLFEILFKVSDSIHQLISIADMPRFKGNVALVKASLSHLITSVRYYSLYTSLLPKVTIQAAITEVAFSVYKLLGVCKVLDNSQRKETDLTIKDLIVHSNDPHSVPIDTELPESPLDSKSTNSSLLQNIGSMRDRSVLENLKEDEEEPSPVKPLKITQKANRSSSMMPASQRKISGAGLFSALMETNRKSGTLPKIEQRSLKVVTDVNADSPSFKKTDNNRTFGNEKPATSPETTVKTPNNSKKSPPSAHSIENTNELDEKNSLNKSSSLSRKDRIPPKIILPEFPKSNPPVLVVNDIEETKPQPKNESVDQNQQDIAKNADPSVNDIKANVTQDSINTIDITEQSLTIDHTIDSKLNESESIIKGTSKLPTNENSFDTSLTDDRLIDENMIGKVPKSVLKEIVKTIPLKKESKKIRKMKEFDTSFEEEQANPTKFTDKMKKFNNTSGIGLRISTEDTSNVSIESDENILFTQAKESIEDNIQPRSLERKLTSSKSFAPTSSKLTDKMKLTLEENSHLIKEEKTPKQPLPKIEDAPIVESVITRNPQDNNPVTEDAADESSEEESEEDFDIDAFDIENPDNTLSELLLYLEHQTVEVISTIQSLLSSIKLADSTKGKLRGESNAISQVIKQMCDATSISMNQSRNGNLKEHGSWVVQSLSDCKRRITMLCDLDENGVFNSYQNDTEFADKHFKQRLAGIAFDIAKCTKELVKSVEEASLKEEIEYLNSHMK